jgi:hypothetical protein
LALGVTAAAAAIGFETDWGRTLRKPLPDALGASAANELTPTLPTFRLGELEPTFKESGERPLFTPTRRPPQAAAAVAAPQMKRGQFKLAGTLVNAGMSVAYLVEIAGNKTHRVNKGSEVLGQPGLLVDTVEPARVVLKMGDETEVLELRTAASPPRPPAPVGVPTPAVPGQPAPVAGVATVAPAVPPVASAAPVPFPGGSPPPTATPSMRLLPGFTGGAPGNPSGTLAQETQEPTAAQRRRRFQNAQPNAPQ